MKQKLTTIGLIVLLILIPAMLSGVLKNIRNSTPVPNAVPSPSPVIYLGWPEYRNDKYHFKLKYPYDWFQIPNEAGTSPIQFVNIPLDTYQDKPHLTFIITVEPFTEEDLFNYPEIKQLIKEGREPRELTISNSPAVLVSNLGESGDIAQTYVLHQKQVFKLTWEQTEIGLTVPYEETLLQMVAAFQFTD